MSGTAELAVLVGIGLVGVLVAVNATLRPFWFILMYAVANIADLGFVVSSRGIGSSSVTLSDLLLAGAFCALLFRRGRRDWSWPATAGPLVVFMLIGGAQLLRGALDGPASALAEGRFVLFPLAYFCAYAAARRVDDPRRFLTLFGATTVAVAIAGINIYLSSTVVNLEFNHVPGRMAGYAVLAIGVLLSGLLPSARRFRPIAILILILFLLVSGSKQALALVPLLYLVVRRTTTHPRTRMMLTTLVVVLVGSALWVAVGGDDSRPAETLRGYEETIRDPSDDGGVAWRLSYWSALVDETPTTDWVTGVGIRPYFTDLELSGFDGDVADTPHNSFLVLTLLGGLPLIAMYVIAMIVATRRYAAATTRPVFSDVALFVLLVTHAFLFFNAEHRIAGVWPMLWVVLGILDAMIDRDEPAVPIPDREDLHAVA